ncbi:hypothetical protein [Sulfitobacter guttiformis]|uniref:Uncharacterized protein n=1 Tax=Sulfitobacter guttiformis TaxID=74349 RepID=A0A420DNH0_9RHOB|nr:hypothetical protein [Sulfitobacter guttiformis]KIN73079.1 hypothetical protein Z949_2261 [Sulfitobacter guttiformis KCTC 32187]RKE95765.1 hypothetical protein C8N30_0302 [Sulfitobacter guttiformis]
MIYILVVGLAIWMFGCGYSGYHKRFGLFVIVLLTGMGLNTLWMMFGLDARPLSPPAITAHAAALMYAISAVGLGFLLGRIVRGFRDSRVTADD